MAALLPMLAVAACGGGGSSGGGGVGTGPAAASVTERRVKVATGPDVSLQVRDWQKPGATGPAIVLLAGLGANARCFDSLAPALASDFSRVIAISRRGYGLSDKPLPVKSDTQHYEVDTLVADLKAAFDELGLSRAVLAGHSIAGNELTHFAGLFPERVQGLVYLDTTFGRSVGQPRAVRTCRDTRGRPIPAGRDRLQPTKFLRIFRRARVIDGDRLAAALKTPHHVTLDNCCHGDFLMEREVDVLRAIRFMTWA
ncbi:alpha/beta fold hydrolase [Variovorax sp. RKNM96]|uniref:alpha/beta fold hydrolase n=1 Tax=Variovorax sp. RKNM96 TaxID=2681552 RepID=UPI00197D1E7A|nr:alpha/beta fold hydrolase [Variovorax sp. RKNM96]QSI32683.1 alpha/beta fold hydrolase [Variovorax sp. RKNM96]